MNGLPSVNAASKRPWAAPRVENISVTEAMLRLTRSRQPTTEVLKQIETLQAAAERRAGRMAD